MWRTVLLMAVAACVDPAKIGVVSYILSRPGPMRRLVAYFIGGFGMSLIIGGVLVFVLDGVSIGKSSSIPPGIEIAVGVIALLVAVLVGTGIAARVRDRTQARHPSDPGSGKPPTAEGKPSGVEKLPGFEKLPHHVQDAVRSESPWIAWIAGLSVGLPTAYYLGAIAAILRAGVGTGAQIGALLVFNLIAFAVVEIPLVSSAIAPDATRARLDQLNKWVSTHQRLVITTLAGIVGVYLILIGVSKL